MSKFQNIIKIRSAWIIAAALLFSSLSHLFTVLNAAEPYDNPYMIDDESELFTILGFKGDRGVKVFDFQKDVLVNNHSEFKIQTGDSITFNLNAFALTGTGDFRFVTVPSLQTPPLDGRTKIKIVGDTAAFYGGLKLHNNIDLIYDGTYISSDLDIAGVNPGDDVSISFNRPGSGWNAAASTPTFITGPLPANLDTLADKHEGVIIIGGAGRADGLINSGNWVLNAETIVGAKDTAAGVKPSTLTISGRGTGWRTDNLLYDNEIDNRNQTRWYASGTFYIGYEGKGITTIDKGAKVSAGSIGVGIRDTGVGQLFITGTGFKPIDNTVGVPNEKDHYWILDKDTPNDPTEGYVTKAIKHGTVSPNTVLDVAWHTIFKTNEKEKLDNTTTVYIFGRDEHDENGIQSSLRSDGAGRMEITNGAHLVFDEHATETTKPSGFQPKMSLGTGASIVDKSVVSGALKNWHDAASSKTGVINGAHTTGTNSLTFTNGSILEGTLKIKMDENRFERNSIITPGYEMYEYVYIDPIDKKFGKLEFDNDTLFLDDTTKTYIDFDAHGDINARSNYANHPIDFDPNNPQNPTKPVKPLEDTLIFDKTVFGGSTIIPAYLPDNGRDVITANGQVFLGGDIYFRPQAGYYSDHIDVNFLEVSGTIRSQFAQNKVHLEPGRWFTNPRLEIINSSDHLLMDRAKTPFTTAGNDHNSKSVGGALDTIYNANNNYSWLHILDWTWLMNDQELQKTMHQLAGEAKASSFYLPLRNQWRYAFERVNWSRNGNSVYFGTQNIAEPNTAKNDLWVTPYYDYLHMTDDGNIGSTTTKRVSFLAGYDHVIQKTPYFGCVSKSAVGFIFGYSQPKMYQDLASVRADDYMLGAHFNTRLYDKYELKLWGGLGAQQYHLARTVPVPKVNDDLNSKYTGTSWSGSIQIARPFYYRERLVVRPLAALDLMVVNQNGANEDDPEAYQQIILQYQKSKWTQLFARTGVRADYAWKKMNFTGSLAYSYLLGGDQAPVSTHRFMYAGGQSFDIQGNNLGRSFLAMGLGTQLTLDCLKTSVVYLQYNGDYSKESNGQTFSVGFQKLF